MSDQSWNAGHPCPAGSKGTLDALVDDLSELEHRLPLLRTDAIAAAALADDVRRRILGGVVGGVGGSGTAQTGEDRRHSAHEAGRRLWNRVVSLRRDGDGSGNAPSPYLRLLLHGRVFAFLAIHASTWHVETDTRTGMAPSRVLSLLDICVRAARSCIDERDTELGRAVLDKASAYVESFVASPDGHPVNEDTARLESRFNNLQTQILVLSTAQLWREKKTLAAEKLYSQEKVMSAIGALDSLTVESFAWMLYDIGKSLLAKREYSASITWLDRAYEMTVRLSQSPQSSDSIKSIHSTLTHALSVASIELGTANGCRRAQDLVQDLEAQLGEGNLNVNIVHLELIAASPSEVFDAPRYAQVLLRMIKHFDGSSSGFQHLHHYIQKLHNKSPGLGCDVLDEFLLDLREKDATEWIEKLVITRVWLLAHQREAQEGIDAAEHVLSKLRISVSADAAVAAQTLMWKRIEQGHQEKQYATAIPWCRLALCHIFEAGGRANRALIERRLLLCSIESGDLEAAKATYVSMSESTRDETMTKYLLFKLSVQLDDLAMASECLKQIGLSTNGRDVLYACVLYARSSKALQFTVQGLKKLVDTADLGHLGTVHTPALFRCTVLMLRDIIDGNIADSNGDCNTVTTAARDLAAVFEGVVEAIEASRITATDTAPTPFSIDELEWFCRASYNLSLKYAGSLDLRSMARILSACRKIIKLFPANLESQVGTDLVSKSLNCHFLIASAMSALARKPEISSAKGQAAKDYRVMREHIMAFQVQLKQPLKTGMKPDISSDHLSKLSALLIFEFEGAIGLGDWDELNDICQKAVVCRNSDAFRVMGDILLHSQAQVPSPNFLSTLRFIIDKLNEVGEFGSDKLIKYYRCLYQGALYLDSDAAFQILEELCRTLKVDPATTGLDMKDESWPEHDIQYLAIKTFNEGLSWFYEGQESRARQWALLATSLAGRCRDGGKLKARIRDNFALLKIGDLELRASIEEDIEEEIVVTGTEEGSQNEAP